MLHLEPTYLRYIYDGLTKGSIHPENATELPDGLIGMYEEAFDERTSVVERQKLLRRFAIWALLKKEVSAAFAAEVLAETEDDIQEFISTHSAWFNSPESGKYQLYHERLKVYLLQKLSEKEIHALHEKLIGRLEKAIEEQNADEFEWYGLEFLAGHLGLSAMLNGDGKKLIELAYSQTHWQRQLKISKGYFWTKNGLKEVMSWASKYNDDEVIECGLQMVDLHHHEQNAAPQIVALVAEGDFDAALKRIEQFGGNDKEGLQRKFILYMLCLMELTLLDSKDKPNRKVGIEKLLKHLDEQLPIDHSVLNWNDFFPSKLMFDILIGVYKQNISFRLIIQRSNYFDLNFLNELKVLTDVEINVIKEIFLFDTTPSLRTIIQISNISNLLYSNNYTQEATFLIVKAKDLSNKIEEYYRDLALKSIISSYHFQKNKNESINLLSAIDSELLKQEIYLYLNEHEEFFDDSVIKIISDFESVEEKLNLLKTGIEISLINNKLCDQLISVYINLLEGLDIFKKPEFQVFLVETYSKINQIENAIEIADEIELFHEQEIAFHIIALWYFNNDNESIFKDYFEKINSPKIKSYVYSNLIVLLYKKDIKISLIDYFELLISEINNLESYSTDDWGNTEYPRNELIIELGLKFQSNGLIDLAIELESLIIDEWNSKKSYYLKIFSDFDFLKDGILSPYFHTYILINKKEIELSRRDEYLIQIITETWVNSYFKKALCILPFITNIQKLEKIISDLVFLSLESLNFSFLPDLLNFMGSESSKDVCLSDALSKSEIKFELNQLEQIFSNFHNAEQRDQNISHIVKKEFERSRPILAIQLIDLVKDPFWKCIGLEYSVYFFGKIKNVEKGKKQLEEIKDIKNRFKSNIDVDKIEMNFFDSISLEMYLSNDENWIDYNRKSISISKKIINQKVKKYNEFFFLLRTKKYSDLLNLIELITDDWDLSLFISGIGIELFCVEHIEIIERIISLYPENRKEGSPEYRNFISKYILLCERNNENQYLVKYYKYFESSWLDSLELAKQLLQINRLKKADQILNSIAEWGKAWAFIRFSKFLRIHNYEKKSKHYLEKGLSISIKKNDSTGIKSATIELINSGNFLLAEKISLEIKNIKDKQDCWSEIGRTLYSNKNKVIINSQFQEIEFKKFVNRSWLEEHTINDSNKYFVINSLPHSIEDMSIMETILQKYFLNKLFLNLNFEEPKNQFDTILKLHWALEIKKQINYIS